MGAPHEVEMAVSARERKRKSTQLQRQPSGDGDSLGFCSRSHGSAIDSCLDIEPPADRAQLAQFKIIGESIANANRRL